jgi:hypothetical protein
MRLILIVLIAVVAFAVVQSYRHHCKFGLEASWVKCVLGREAVTATPTSGEAPAPAPSPAPQ